MTVIIKSSGRQLLFYVHAFVMKMFLENFVIIFSTLQPNKSAKNVPLGEPPGDFCDVGCYCFLSLEVFNYWATFLCHW